MKKIEKFFKKVPQPQYLILKQFIEKHPVKTSEKKGIKYEYIKTEKGKQTLVFIHGALFSPDMWFYPISKLEKEYSIIAVKLPKLGMGANDSVEYIKTIMDIENVNKAIVIGYSYGGGIAQYFAEKYPNYIDTLVLTHTGVLRREDSLNKTKKLLRKLKYLPSWSIQVVKYFRTKSGKESEWYRFRKAYFNWMFSSITLKDFIEHFKLNLIFLKEIEYLPIGKASWKGNTILLATKSDRDTYQYFKSLMNIYDNSSSYVFNEPGGHHMLFLYPEKYTDKLNELLHQTKQ
jgi:pimeloyl-ACP methyl ester carboxylesterase